MRIKPFLLVLAIFLAAGGLTGSLTGLFTSSDTAGGMPTSAAATNGRGEAARQQGSQSPQGDSGFDPQQIRERIQSGELTREDLANLRERFQGAGGRGSQQGSAGSTRFGTVTAVAENTITLSGFQGESAVTVEDDTKIQQFTNVGIDGLSANQQVTVIGQRGEQGVVAQSIVVTPEGVDLSRLGALRERLLQAGGPGSGTQGADRGFGALGRGQGRAASGLEGTIEAIRGNAITINSEQGPLSAIVDDETVIRVVAPVSLAAVAGGSRIVAIGTAGNEGTFAASWILIIPQVTQDKTAATTSQTPPETPQSTQANPASSSNPPARSLRNAMAGEVTSLQERILTIETETGPQRVDISPDTIIRKFADGGPATASIGDFTPGVRVRITGKTDDQGVIQAETIFIVPASLSGRGSFGRGGGGQGQTSD